MKKLLSALCLSGIMCTPVLAGDITIEQIAPEDSMVVVGTTSLDGLRKKFEASGFMDLLNDASMQDAVASASGMSWDDIMGQFDEMREQLGLEEGDPKLPSGAAGFALYMTEGDAGVAPAMLAFAELGENAADFNRFLDRILEFGENEQGMTWEENELAGRTVLTFELGTGDIVDDMMVDEFGGPPVGLPEKLHLVRGEKVLMVGSDVEALGQALDLIDNGGATKFADQDEYQGAVAEIGTGDIHGVLMVNGIFNMMAATDPMMGMIRPMVTRFIGDIRSLGFNASLEDGEVVSTSSLSVYMPVGKSGLSALFDSPSSRGDIPTFAGSDVVSYTSMNVEFGSVMELVGQIMAMAGPMLGGGADMDQMAQIIGPIFDALDERVQIFSTMHGSAGDGEAGSLISIACKDAQAFEDAISALAPQAGLEPRDFLGSRIYSMDPAMMGAMGAPGMEGGASIGIGGSHVFFGPDASVEQALRTVSNADAGDDGDNEALAQALSHLSGDNVVAWGCTRLVDVMEMDMHQQIRDLKAMAEEMREFDPEMADEMISEVEPMQRMLDAMDFDKLRSLMGYGVWEAISNDNGFVLRSKLISGN